MKILQVNKYYYPRGGADKYFLDLIQAQKRAGHQVASFAMQNVKNLATPWSSYFISPINFNQGTLKDKLKTPGRVLYSLEARKKFKKLLNDFQPDIIHIHNIYHQISPSILSLAKERKIPILMHLHDYKLICPNHTLFTNGKICERCHSNNYYECLKNKCLKNSFLASALASVEMYFHHSLLKIYEKNIDYFIAPSKFMKKICVNFGQKSEQIKIIYNPYSSELINLKNDNFEKKIKISRKMKNNNYFLYFGRLSPEKGLKTLIKAAVLSKKKIKIVGEGPEKNNLKNLRLELQAPIEFLGFKKGKELKKLIIQAQAIIIPSIWYENMPLSLLEALSLGKIVIASNIGGLGEIIIDGENGLLFTPGDEKDLQKQFKRLRNINKLKMKMAAKKSVQKFKPQNNLQEIMNLYQELLVKKKNLEI